MMDDFDDGANPMMDDTEQEGPWQRDDFAMLAMQALLGAKAERCFQSYPAMHWQRAMEAELESIAIMSYKMADAMFEARDL